MEEIVQSVTLVEDEFIIPTHRRNVGPKPTDEWLINVAEVLGVNGISFAVGPDGPQYEQIMSNSIEERNQKAHELFDKLREAKAQAETVRNMVRDMFAKKDDESHSHGEETH